MLNVYKGKTELGDIIYIGTESDACYFYQIINNTKHYKLYEKAYEMPSETGEWKNKRDYYFKRNGTNGKVKRQNNKECYVY